MHAFRTPERAPQSVVDATTDYRCGSGHPDNGRGKPLLRKGGHIAYPGTVDDWMNMLSNGRRITATGNSDTHTTTFEIGIPRTYLAVSPGDDGEPRDRTMGEISDADVVEALRNQRALVTNGPLLDLAVVTGAADGTRSWPVGSTVEYATSNVDREVTILVTVQSAPWIDVKRVVLYENGEPTVHLEVPAGKHVDGRDLDDSTSFRLKRRYQRDTFIVAEAFGENSMFPVVTPYEAEPTDVGQALGGVLAGLGSLGAVGATRDGISAPDFVQVVTLYALTNPIWLDVDASGEFDPPGPPIHGPGPGPRDPCQRLPSSARTSCVSCGRWAPSPVARPFAALGRILWPKDGSAERAATSSTT